MDGEVGGHIGEAKDVDVGVSGGVGRLLMNVNGEEPSLKSKALSVRGDRSGRVTMLWTIVPESFLSWGLTRMAGCSVVGRNSDEAVFDDRDSCGRCLWK